MATRRVTQYVDDLDGTELADEGRTIRFAVNGREYEIDLGGENEQKLHDALEPFVDAARPIRTLSARGKISGGRSTSKKSDVDLAAVRTWARDNGHAVNDRGRIPAAIVEAYQAAK